MEEGQMFFLKKFLGRFYILCCKSWKRIAKIFDKKNGAPKHAVLGFVLNQKYISTRAKKVLCFLSVEITLPLKYSSIVTTFLIGANCNPMLIPFWLFHIEL